MGIEEKLKLKKLLHPKVAKPIIKTIKGKKGDRGLPGKPGKQGPPGKDGKSIQGPPGKYGENGADGKNGLPGTNGRNGKDWIPTKEELRKLKGEPGDRGKPGRSGGTGSGKLNIRTETANYAISNRDDVILANGTFTVTLPDNSILKGKTYFIKNIGTGVITISGTIDSDTDFDLIKHEVIEVIADEAGWWII